MQKKILSLLAIIGIAMLLIICSSNTVLATEGTDENNEEPEMIYLSDINYQKGTTGWGTILKDKTSSNTLISMYVDGNLVNFKKGMWAHATSELVYDLSNYNYDYFSTYYGVCTTSGNKGDGVKFTISTSTDGANWTVHTPQPEVALKSGNGASFIKINIKGAKYLKLYAHQNGANGNDHSVYGDAKLFKEGYRDSVTKTVEEYDAEIKAKYTGGELTEELELLLLQREFVSRVGEYTLKQFIEENPELNQKTLDWLLNDHETLKLYLVGGRPEGTYLKSLKVLTEMYNNNKEDWETTQMSKFNSNIPLKDVYRTMILAISLTHSGNVYLWIDGRVHSTPQDRYDIYKELYNDGLIESAIFETLTVEEMRWVMNTIIDDEEIKWLNNYTRTVKNGATGPYSYIRYTFGYNYWLEKYYNQETWDETWNKKYNLSDWGVGNVSGYPKLWIVFEEGSVCGGLSKTGSCVWGAYKGLPSTCVSQPGHCAYAMFSRNADGDGVWNLGNDVGGWGPCGNTEHLSTRMMNDWRATEGGWAGPYILIAQAAQNEYEVYEKAQIQMMLAQVYSGDATKQEEIYRNVTKMEKVNFGAWESLINLYIADSNKTEEQYCELASEVIDALTYYPKPMTDLLTKIERKLSSPEYITQFNNMKTKALKTALVADSSKTIQVTAVKQVAQFLLGLYDPTVATFSFDGENANSIVLAEKYKDSELQWDYSLDKGATWYPYSTEHVLDISENINLITAENDIWVHINGVDYSEKNIFVIDITKANMPSNLYNNDLENRVINATDVMQWRFSDDEEWTLYRDAQPDLTGDKTVTLRVGPTGTQLPSDACTYSFTEDNQPDTRKYIPVSNLSLQGVSSEATGNNGHGIHAIDADINTIWHSNYNGQDKDRYIIIKLAEPKYISALEYIPRQSGTNGRVNGYSLSLSMDGANFTEVATGNWANNADTKSIELEESVKAQYVKLQAKTNYGDGRNFISAMMINLFEDTTGERPRASIEYIVPDSAAQPVVAKLVNPSTKITITNNGGSDTYTFIDNGSFTFEFEDESHRKGTATATVLSISDCSFAFDGDMANKIVISSKYKPAETDNLEWQYSLDGGSTWSEIQHTLIGELSPEEIARITENEDIQLRINIKESAIGEMKHTINIEPSSPLPSNLYANDLENRLIGATSTMEWRLEGQTQWTSFDAENKTTFSGDKTIEVRLKAVGTTPPSEPGTFTFTQDEENSKKAYIPISNLSIESYSSQSIRPERNEYEPAFQAIDGNINTIWHTDHTRGVNADGSSIDGRYIVIKLTEPKYISHIQYVAKQNYNYGIMQEGIVEVSVDNENWTKVADITGREATTTQDLEDKRIKEIPLENPAYAKYVKIQCTKSYDYVFGTDRNTGQPMNYFINAAMFNFFEDTDLTESAEVIDAKIEYSTEQKTTGSVIATIRSVDGTPITIVNNDGKNTYEFIQNGEFTFEYIDSNNRWGTKTAKVDWIGEAPTATVVYSTTDSTTENVIATITFSDEVRILTEGFELEKKDNKTYTYTFSQNLSFTLEFEDLNGNRGEPINLFVNWIENKAPIANITYNITDLTNQNVIATISCDEPITITNNNGQNTYTFTENDSFVFEYMSEDYVRGTVTAKVDWIDKEAPVAKVTYDITEETPSSVTATLICDTEEIIITNNGGINTYTFTENGEFIFEYKDLAGNVNTTIAKVDWINKNAEIYIESDKYTVDNENSRIYRIIPKATVATFKGNVQTNSKITIINKKGNILADEDIISTGDTLKLENSQKVYTLVVTGDINGDGKISITDVVKSNLMLVHLLESTKLEEIAADINNNGELTITDVVKLNLVLIGLRKIEY